MPKKTLSLIIFFYFSVLIYGQNRVSEKPTTVTTTIVFRDTVFDFVLDSLSHHLGRIVPTNENNRLVKHFKYIGTEPIFITRVWTSDPHYICEYPKEPLHSGKIYSFTVCFWHQERQGMMNKVMGFDLSDGSKISFRFTGTYIANHK